MDGTAENKSGQITSETKSENNSVNSQPISSNTPAKEQHTTPQKVSRRKQNKHKQKEERIRKRDSPDDMMPNRDSPDDGTSHGDSPDDGTSHGDSPDDGTSHGDSPDDGTSHGDSPDDGTSHGDHPDDAMPQGDSADNEISHEDSPVDVTSHGDSPNKMSQGDSPDERTSQEDGMDGGTSQGDSTDEKTSQRPVELLQQLEELHSLDGETPKELDESTSADHNAETSCKTKNEMYEKGQKLLKVGKNEAALKCFLQCLKGLEQHNTFAFLPQCLRNVADIYYKQEEYDKAVQFIQAEKMFYETSLIDTSARQKLLEDRKKERDGSGEEQPTDPNANHPDALRADEFENLARMCLQKNQSQLALEYQGKATKLRKQVYGDNHLVTMKSLDFFTVVYGEVGKQQYSESMERITAATPGGDTVTETIQEGSTLRHRSSAQQEQQGGDNIVQQAEFTEMAEDATEREEWLSRLVLWILFMLCIGCLSVIIFYLYCKIDVTSRSCQAWKADMNYHWMHLKYLYYTYISTAKNKFSSSG